MDGIPFKATVGAEFHTFQGKAYLSWSKQQVFSHPNAPLWNWPFFFFFLVMNAPQLSSCQADCRPTSRRQQRPNSFSLRPPRSSARIPIALESKTSSGLKRSCDPVK